MHSPPEPQHQWFNDQADELVEKLKPLLPRAEVIRGPSNVTGSPYDYVFVCLEPTRHHSTHIVISDAQEYGDDHWFFVGRHDHETAGKRNAMFQETGDAIDFVRKLAMEYYVKGVPTYAD